MSPESIVPENPYSEDGFVYVESRSEPGVSHRVNPARRNPTCTCDAFYYRGGLCAHIRIARIRVELWREGRN